MDLTEHKMQFELVHDRPDERDFGQEIITPAAVLPNLAAFAVARGATLFA